MLRFKAPAVSRHLEWDLLLACLLLCFPRTSWMSIARKEPMMSVRDFFILLMAPDGDSVVSRSRGPFGLWLQKWPNRPPL